MSSVPTNQNPSPEVGLRQRAAARRTAWVLGVIAIAVYAVFLASSGMFAQ